MSEWPLKPTERGSVGEDQSRLETRGRADMVPDYFDLGKGRLAGCEGLKERHIEADAPCDDVGQGLLWIFARRLRVGAEELKAALAREREQVRDLMPFRE